MNEQAAAWLTAVDGLPQVHERLRRVVIRCKPALSVIEAEDGPNTLFYLDPTYLHETRTAPKTYGPYEMTRSDHDQLITHIKGSTGKVMLSGYRSQLYDERLVSWNRHDFDLPNNAAGGTSKRRMTECVWTNF